jgi:hypothetical protein
MMNQDEACCKESHACRYCCPSTSHGDITFSEESLRWITAIGSTHPSES